MLKLGRNDPCPCRGGLKYKRCCLPLHQRARAHMARPVDLDLHMGGVEALSNEIPEMWEQGRFAEAEQLAKRLLEEYPGDPDGVERLAEVYARMGDHERAAPAFRRAAAFHRVLMPRNVKLAAWLDQQAERMDQGLEIAWPEGDLD